MKFILALLFLFTQSSYGATSSIRTNISLTGSYISASLNSLVTSTPDAVGEYRTYVKGSSSAAGTDTTPSAGYGVDSSNGMRIQAISFGSAGTSGQPTRWEMYIGTNKKWIFEAYQTTGRSGGLDWKFYYDSGGSTSVGMIVSYDPSSGVLSVDSQFAGSTANACGRTIPVNGAASSTDSDCYFDVFVFD